MTRDPPAKQGGCVVEIGREVQAFQLGREQLEGRV